MEEVAEFLIYLISLAEQDGDNNYWRESYNNEDMASNLYTVVSYVKVLFAEWVDDTIKEVDSIGFSFADVDLIYIKEICRKLSVDAV